MSPLRLSRVPSGRGSYGPPACLLAGVVGLCLATPSSLRAQDDRPDNTPPPGFTALFDGESLEGWKGLVESPPKRRAMTPDALAAAQQEADQRMREHWSVEDGVLVFDGEGDSLVTARDWKDFELYVDWKILPAGDSGIYLRGSPQVQIWDIDQHPEGSGGLYNNRIHPSRPLIPADRPVGKWNTFRIIMVGERVSVYLNDRLVVNDTVLENYWERDRPIYRTGAIELQNHGNTLYFKNIYAREIVLPQDRLPRDEPLVEQGDLVAVCGDSITEQRIYSRFIEDYLTACVPHLDLRVMQFGWSGERAPGFAARVENDVLPFEPDVVTLCYGMNDGLYRPYTEEIGETFEVALGKIVERLERAGCRVVVGSPGAVDTHTFGRGRLTAGVYNRNLARLRDIARETAFGTGQVFANVHDPMLNAQLEAKPELGEDYHVAGGDGIHPAPNGHLIMAHAFLRALGLEGHIGTITVDMEGRAEATAGHEVLAAGDGKVELESRRWPFCFSGDESSPGGTRSILPYTRFEEDLNRLVLRVRNLPGPRAKVTWGGDERVFSRERLEAGINLAAEFVENPFSGRFAALDRRVREKQRFETSMVKDVITRFRAVHRLLGENVEAGAALETLRRKLRQKDEELRERVRAAHGPVRHVLEITPQ